MDRRQTNRCPMCQGPALQDPKSGHIKCRRSICIQNHLEVRCPRCKKADLDTVSFENGSYAYTCRECTHSWSVKIAS